MTLENFLSTQSPVARDFHGMDALDQSGGLLGVGYAMIVWALPVGIAIALTRHGAGAVAAGEAGLLLLLLAIYRLFLLLAARRLRERADLVGESLRD